MYLVIGACNRDKPHNVRSLNCQDDGHRRCKGELEPFLRKYKVTICRCPCHYIRTSERQIEVIGA